MTFTVWRTSSHGEVFVRRRLRHRSSQLYGAFYDRRSCNREGATEKVLLCCNLSGVERPSALGDVIGVSSSFPETSQDSSVYPILPVIDTYILCPILPPSFFGGFKCIILCFSFYRVIMFILQSSDIMPSKSHAFSHYIALPIGIYTLDTWRCKYCYVWCC